MSMFGNKTLSQVKKILGRCHGGIYKRIDENRELLELLQRAAPELLAKQPWIVRWLESQDCLLCDLESAVPLSDVQFPKQRCFPRPWPTTLSTVDGAATHFEQSMFGNKTLSQVEKILGRRHGGIYKRIDENRELLELLQRAAPELLAKQSWIVRWLESQDCFLCDLESAVPLSDVYFPKQRCFPRPWPTRLNSAI